MYQMKEQDKTPEKQQMKWRQATFQRKNSENDREDDPGPRKKNGGKDREDERNV